MQRISEGRGQFQRRMTCDLARCRAQAKETNGRFYDLRDRSSMPRAEITIEFFNRGQLSAAIASVPSNRRRRRWI